MGTLLYAINIHTGSLGSDMYVEESISEDGLGARPKMRSRMTVKIAALTNLSLSMKRKLTSMSSLPWPSMFMKTVPFFDVRSLNARSSRPTFDDTVAVCLFASSVRMGLFRFSNLPR